AQRRRGGRRRLLGLGLVVFDRYLLDHLLLLNPRLGRRRGRRRRGRRGRGDFDHRDLRRLFQRPAAVLEKRLADKDYPNDRGDPDDTEQESEALEKPALLK